MSYTAEPKQQDTNIKVPLISKIAYGIRMRQVDQVKDFVDLLSKYPYEMDLVSGRYTIDAKSLLGIYSLDLSNPLTLVIYSDSCEELLTQLHALLPDCIV